MPIKKRTKPKLKVELSLADDFRAFLVAREAVREAGEGDLPEPSVEVQRLMGFLEAAVLVANADGDIDDEEADKLVDLCSRFLEGEWQEGSIAGLLLDIQATVGEEGVEARVEYLANLFDEEGRALAFDLACIASLISEGEDEDDEDEVLMSMASAFGIDIEEAQERYAAFAEAGELERQSGGACVRASAPLPRIAAVSLQSR